MSMIPETQSTRKYNYDAMAEGEYEARIVRIVGLGVHPQDPWVDRKTGVVTQKAPAFRLDLAFEIIGHDTKGTDSEGKPIDPKPACQFKTYIVNPRAKNSGILDLIKMIDPSIQALKADLNWIRDKLLGQPVNLLVNQYTNKAGQVKNSIKTITAIPTKYRDAVGDPRCETVFFDPYIETDENVAAYSLIFPFQRNLLTVANDAKNIPLAGREVVKGGDTEQKEPTAKVETIDKEPVSTTADDDESPF